MVLILTVQSLFGKDSTQLKNDSFPCKVIVNGRPLIAFTNEQVQENNSQAIELEKCNADKYAWQDYSRFISDSIVVPLLSAINNYKKVDTGQQQIIDNKDEIISSVKQESFKVQSVMMDAIKSSNKKNLKLCITTGTITFSVGLIFGIILITKK